MESLIGATCLNKNDQQLENQQSMISIRCLIHQTNKQPTNQPFTKIYTHDEYTGCQFKTQTQAKSFDKGTFVVFYIFGQPQNS